MADFDDPDSEHIVLNGVNDAIISLADSITLLAGELFATRWPRIFFKKVNGIDDALEVLCGDGIKVLYGRSLKIDLICGHCA